MIKNNVINILKVIALAVIAVLAIAVPTLYSSANSSKTEISSVVSIELTSDNMVMLRGEVNDESINKASIELYEKVKASILNLADNIEIKPQKYYIAFKKGNNISDIEIQKKGLKIFINAKIGTLDDPKRLLKDVSNIGHQGNGDYQIQIVNDDDLEYIMSLIKQVLR